MVVITKKKDMEIKVKVIFKSMSAAGALGLFAPEENTKRK